jgi:RNA methyltransferase, TrmH family
MDIPILSSRENVLVRAIRSLAVQARRAPADLVLAEGLRVLEEATRAGLEFEAVLVAPDFGTVPREEKLLRAWKGLGIRVRRATPALLDELSDVVSPQGAVALIRISACSLASVLEISNPLIMCLCGIQDPGNLGTLLRSARAASASWVGCLTGSVSARNPKAIRAGAGAIFHLAVIERLSAAEFRGYCNDRGIRLYQADARRGCSCWEADFRGPTALLLGNEARGLPASEWAGVPFIRIPMAPGVESLNVAAAGAVLLFEAMRQRSRHPTGATREA